MAVLNIFKAMHNVDVEEYEEKEKLFLELREFPQIFPSHDELSERFCKTLYYGKLPASDRPSLHFTHIAVDQFTSAGLDALGDKLGRLDMIRAADITRNACAGSNSLVLALLYLDKLRKRNPDYLTTVSSADLFLVSLMVASKFLHDDGEEDEVFNDEWASSGGIDTNELNRLELSFLSALDWRIYVDSHEFQIAVAKLETNIAFKEVIQRGWASYTDFEVLSRNSEIQNLLNNCIIYTMQMCAICVTAYAAGILSLLGTAAALNRTSVGPAAVSSSISILTSSLVFDQENLDPSIEISEISNDVAYFSTDISDFKQVRSLVDVNFSTLSNWMEVKDVRSDNISSKATKENFNQTEERNDRLNDLGDVINILKPQLVHIVAYLHFVSDLGSQSVKENRTEVISRNRFLDRNEGCNLA